MSDDAVNQVVNIVNVKSVVMRQVSVVLVVFFPVGVVAFAYRF
jgi:hypothetical protein